jgi:hypothetical protein
MAPDSRSNRGGDVSGGDTGTGGSDGAGDVGVGGVSVGGVSRPDDRRVVSAETDGSVEGGTGAILPKPQIEIIVDGNSIFKPGMKTFFVDEEDHAVITSDTEGVVTGEFCTCDYVYTTVPSDKFICTCDMVCTCENVCSCDGYVSCTCESVCDCDGYSSCSCLAYSTSCSCQSVSCGSPCACVPVH